MDNITATPEKQFGFVAADFVVFAASICICIGIGLYYAITGGRRQTTLEYLLGNRRLKMIPVALSLAVSFESSIFMLGLPAEVYIYGAFTVIGSLSYAIGCISGGAFIVVPLFHPLKLTSVFEYMELRFKSPAPRLLCTAIGMLYYLFYMGIVLYGPATALQAVMQFPVSSSILLVAVVSMLYTAMGGIKAVIWTDVLQCAIMFMGMFAIIIKSTIISGGVESVWNINKQYRRLDIFDFRLDPTIRHTVWNIFIGTTIRSFSVVFNQTSGQRISAVSTTKEARVIFYISGAIFCISGLLIHVVGLASFSYFNTVGCDPLAANEISNPNQIIPYMVVRLFHNQPGMSGLFMAALFSASLSTLSSGLNSLSAQFTQDFVKRYCRSISDIQATVVAKISVIVFGAIAVGISFVISKVQGSFIQISGSILTAFSGPAAGMFVYASLFPWAKVKGAMTGSIVSMAFIFWISMMQNFSSAVVKQPWLPLNPVDQCFTQNASSDHSYNQASDVFSQNVTMQLTESYNNRPSLENYEQVINEFWNLKRTFFALSYTWFGALGIITVLIIGSIVDIVTGYPDPKDVDVRYVLPMGDTLFPYLPKRFRKFLEFGVPFEKRTEWLKEKAKGTENIIVLQNEDNMALMEQGDKNTVFNQKSNDTSHPLAVDDDATLTESTGNGLFNTDDEDVPIKLAETGINNTTLSDTIANDADLLNNINNTDTTLSDTDVNNTTLSNTDVNNAFLLEADAKNTTLSDADVNNTTLSNTDVNNAFLLEADVNNTTLSDTDINNTALQSLAGDTNDTDLLAVEDATTQM